VNRSLGHESRVRDARVSQRAAMSPDDLDSGPAPQLGPAAARRSTQIGTLAGPPGSLHRARAMALVSPPGNRAGYTDATASRSGNEVQASRTGSSCEVSSELARALAAARAAWSQTSVGSPAGPVAPCPKQPTRLAPSSSVAPRRLQTDMAPEVTARPSQSAFENVTRKAGLLVERVALSENPAIPPADDWRRNEERDEPCPSDGEDRRRNDWVRRVEHPTFEGGDTRRHVHKKRDCPTGDR
jgi:hypothetical protein